MLNLTTTQQTNLTWTLLIGCLIITTILIVEIVKLIKSIKRYRIMMLNEVTLVEGNKVINSPTNQASAINGIFSFLPKLLFGKLNYTNEDLFILYAHLVAVLIGIWYLLLMM